VIHSSLVSFHLALLNAARLPGRAVASLLAFVQSAWVCQQGIPPCSDLSKSGHRLFNVEERH
jgi:hypothetical protein